MTKHELEQFKTVSHPNQKASTHAVVGVASIPVVRGEVSVGQPEVEGAGQSPASSGREQSTGVEL